MHFPPSSLLRGSLYGVAVTGTLGGLVEFRPRGAGPSSFTKYHYNPNFDLSSGTFTDDMSMTSRLAAR